MNKQGEWNIGFKEVMYIPRIIFLIIVVMTTSGLVIAYIVTNIDVAEVESHVLANRIQYARDGIVTYDAETERTYSGMINEERFNGGNLESSTKAAESRFAIRLVKTDLYNGYEEVAFVNENTYYNWRPIAALVIEEKAYGAGLKTPHRDTRLVTSNGKSAKLETVVITAHG